MKEKTLYIIATVLALLALFGISQAKAEQVLRINYMNKCADIDPVALATAEAMSDPKQRYAEVTKLWKCLNGTQAAQRPETREQIIEAITKAKYKKDITIYSIDPLRPNKDAWVFGAWKRGKYIFFSAMPGCPNARVELTRLLRRLK